MNHGILNDPKTLKGRNDMKGILFAILTILILIIGYAVFIITFQSCKQNPLPVPMPIISLGPYYVNTDQGRLYPGQTYSYMNEGPWVGNLTLLFASPKRAIFLIHYPIDYPTNSQRAVCKSVYP
jgi:hypothetical protein